jgi:hypothetical protein
LTEEQKLNNTEKSRFRSRVEHIFGFMEMSMNEMYTQCIGIDAMQWHNWFDNEAEFGLRIGLRKFGSHGLERKDVWFAYQAAGTPAEDDVFRKYLSVIGITDWEILKNIY